MDLCVSSEEDTSVYLFIEKTIQILDLFSLSLLLNKEIKKGKEIRQVVVQKKKMKSDKCSLFRDFFFFFSFLNLDETRSIIIGTNYFELYNIKRNILG